MARLINPFAGIMLIERDKRNQLPIALRKLIDSYNKLKESEAIERLFHLQKINFILNQMPFDQPLFNWANTSHQQEGSWEHALTTYGINSHASFFLKSAQFASAVAKEAPEVTISEEDDLYALMQKRDALLAKDTVSPDDTAAYIDLCCRINHLVQTKEKFKKIIERHEEILKLAKDKITDTIGHTRKNNPEYTVKPLGEAQGNNVNVLFKMTGWSEPLVFRIEDRAKLPIEQRLHSYPVATDYFGDDAAIFMMQFKKVAAPSADPDDQSADKSKDKPGDDFELEFSPVALSQFANQGDLQKVAKELRVKNVKLDKILAEVKHYFVQLNQFCVMLEEADETYHPDIKLSNFLVHNNKLLVCDRKTFVRGRQQCAVDIRASKYHAPREYRACVNEDWNELLPCAATTFFDMPQFMAYEVGMALKEFLGLTQVEKLPKGFYNPAYDVKKLFTGKLNRQIENYALIIQAMTADKEGCRLSIPQFQQLIPYVNHPTEVFKKSLSEMLSNKEHLERLKSILGNKKLKGAELLEKAAVALESMHDSAPKMSQVKALADALATKCTKDYVARQAHAVGKAMAAKDWAAAPWYRKFAYYLSLSLFDVAHVTQVKDVSIEFDFDEYENYMYLLDFLPETNNPFATSKLKLFQDFIQVNHEKIKAATIKAPEPEAPEEAPKEDSTIELTVEPTVVRSFADKEVPEENDKEEDNGTFVARPGSNLRNGPQVDVAGTEDPFETLKPDTDQTSKGPSFFNRFAAQQNQTPGPRHRSLHRKGTVLLNRGMSKLFPQEPPAAQATHDKEQQSSHPAV